MQTVGAGVAAYPFTVYAFREVEVEGPPGQTLRGSCQDYDTRTPIDAAATLHDQSLEQVVERWGGRLIVAATQSVREAVLFPPTVSILTQLTLHQYCLLERIGRSRWNGETTCGRFPLNEYNQFHLRKPMIRSRLLAKQLYYEKVNEHNTQGLLLHLPRFYRIFKPKAMLIVEQVVEMLRQSPEGRMEYTVMMAHFEEDLLQAVRKVFKTPMLHQFVCTDVRVPFRTLRPNARVDEWRSKNSQTERQVRCCQLRNPQLEVCNMWTQSAAVVDPATADGGGGGGDDGGSDTENGGLFDQSQLDLNEPMLRQAYLLLEAAGCTGLSQKCLARRLGLPKLNMRMVVRNLARMGLTDTYLKDEGRQRTTVFILKRFCAQRSAQLADELARSSLAGGRGAPGEVDDTLQRLPVDDNLNLAGDLERQLTAAADADEVAIAAAFEADVVKVEEDALERESADAKPPPVDLPISVVQLELRELDRLPSAKMRRHSANFMTARMGKRLQIIDQALRRHHVIDDVYKLYHTIHQVERQMGYKDEMCRRSIKRLVSQLCEERKVRLWLVRVTFKTVTAVHMYISEPTVEGTSPVMQRQLDKEKVKFLLRLNSERARLRVRPSVRGGEVGAAKLPAAASFAKSLLPPPAKVSSAAQPSASAVAAADAQPTATKPSAVSKSSSAVNYGNIPKFIRMRTLHEFLYYLVYAQSASQPPVGADEAIRGWRQQQPTVDYEALRPEMSQAYSADLNWRTFVPPLQKGSAAAAADDGAAAAAANPYTDGWLLLSDALLRMPLSVFVNVQNINYEVPGLEQQLRHPVRKHFLLSFLPAELQDALLGSRKYLFAVVDVLRRLCSLGLLQLGPQRAYNKEHAYIYVNRHASLLDTIASEPGYFQTSAADYPRCAYRFDATADVDSYWHDLHRICTSTRLNRRGAPNVEYEANAATLWDTSPAMVATWQMRTADQVRALDCGAIPGDGRGAGGLDSTLFAHLQRNWAFARNRQEPKRVLVAKRRGPALMTNMQQKQRLGARSKQTTARRLVVATKLSSAGSAPGSSKTGTAGKTRPAKKLVVRLRKVRSAAAAASSAAAAAAVRQPQYDEIDQQALRRMVKLRVDWSREEDNFLLLTRAAHLILCPNYRRLNVTSAHVRDLLHWHCKSLNKTSRACQRRIVYMLKQPAKAAQFHLSVQEARELPEVRRRFGPDFYAALRKQLPGEVNFVAALKIFYVELVYLLLHNVHRLTAMSSMATTSGADPADGGGGGRRTLPHGFRYRRPSCCAARSILPGTLAEFRAQFDWRPEEYEHQRLRFAQPRSTHDIETVSVGQLIHSSCCCTLDKTTWNIQLYDIYKTYAESVLAGAMAKMRDEQLISANKLSVPSRQTTRSLPLNSTPYHLSQRYNLMMLTALPVDLLDDAWQARQTMVAGGRLDRFRVRRINGGYCLLLAEVLHRLAAGGGLHCSIEIPSPIIVFDSSHLSVNKSNLERIKNRYSSIFDFVNNENAYKLSASEVAPATSAEDKLHEQQRRIAADRAIDRLQLLEDSASYHYFCVLGAIGTRVSHARLQIDDALVCSLPSCVNQQPANTVAACTEICQRPGMAELLLEIGSVLPPGKLDDDEFEIGVPNVLTVFAWLASRHRQVAAADPPTGAPPQPDDGHVVDELRQIAVDIAAATSTTGGGRPTRPPPQPRVRTVTISELENRTHEYHLGAVERLMKMDDSMLHFFCTLDAIGTRSARTRLHIDNDMQCSLSRCVQDAENPVAAAVEICNRPAMVDTLSALLAGDTATVTARLGDGEFEICAQNVLAVFTVLVSRQQPVDTIHAHGMPQLALDIVDERQHRLDLNVDEVVSGPSTATTDAKPAPVIAPLPVDKPTSSATDEKTPDKDKDDGEEDGDRVSKLHDYFFLNSTKVSLTLADTGRLCPDNRLKHELLDSLCAEHTWPPVAVERPADFVHYGDDDAALCDGLLDHLERQLEIGASASELHGAFDAYTRERLEGALRLLEHDRLVLRTGVTEYVYVLARYAKPWLIGSYNLKRLQRETMVPSAVQMLRIDGATDPAAEADGSGSTAAKRRKLSDGTDEATVATDPADPTKRTVVRQTRKTRTTVTLDGALPAECQAPPATAASTDRPLMLLHMKPWLRVNGSLNRRCFDRWLATVLMHCASNAGITLDQLARRFYLLLPVHVRDLLEYMQRLRWVRLVALRRASAPQTAFAWEAYVMPQEGESIGGMILLFLN